MAAAESLRCIYSHMYRSDAGCQLGPRLRLQLECPFGLSGWPGPLNGGLHVVRRFRWLFNALKASGIPSAK